MKDRVVVFGGSGFLGSHVADALSEREFSVTVYDIKKSPYLKKGQKMVIGDIVDEKKVGMVTRGAKYVYNFAGQSDIDSSLKDPLKTIQDNIMGHAIILENCRLNGVKRILYASSIYVYSKLGGLYKTTKQASEHLTEDYCEKYKLDYTIMRYGSLYGPRAQRWNGVYNYLYQAVTKNRINYPGTGQERREYIHVLDAARLSVEVLHENYLNRHVVITGASSLSSKELLCMIKEILGGKIKINYTKQSRLHHYLITPYSYIPKIGMRLASNPSIDMGEGLLRQIEEIHHETKNI